MLLLRANEVVSRDRLIDEVWGEWPPPSAQHTLEAYVSRIRKALNNEVDGAQRIVTRPPGYLIRVAPDELDADRFERLVDEGRRTLARGESERAADQLAQALEVWRGPALADVQLEDIARADLDRFEELRLQAIEMRIEADLALGRQADLVAELERLVAQYPARERFRGQLMLALYREGRQADALLVYREAYSYLDDVLGLEPGSELKALERAILRQDDALELRGAPDRSRPPSTERLAGSRSRVRVGLALAILCVTLVALAVLLPLTLLGSSGASRPQARNALVVMGHDGAVKGRVVLPGLATDVAAGFGSLWVSSSDANAVTRIDQETRVVSRSISVGSGPSGLTIGGDAVWVANSLGGTVSRIDPRTSEITDTIEIGSRPTDVLFAGGSLWISSASEAALFRLDPGRTPVRIVLESLPTSLAAGGGHVWAASSPNRTVTRIDLGTNAVDQTVSVGGGPAGMAYVDGALWVANSLDGTVSRVDPERGIVTSTVEVGNGPVSIAANEGALWVANEFGGTVVRVDPATGDVVDRAPVGSQLGGVAAAAPEVWIAARGARRGHRGGTLRLVYPIARFDSIDPTGPLPFSPATLLGMTNDGLVTFKHVGGGDGVTLVPDLAVALPVASAGGRTYSFTLRRGIKYSTGRPVRPGDVRASFERLFRLGSSGTGFYVSIVGAPECTRARCDLSRGILTNEDAGTVTFRLSKPDPDFPYKLALPFAYVIPADSPLHDVGLQPLPATGPYRIASYRPGKTLRLVRNTEFREWSRAAQPDGYPDAIVWRLGLPLDQALTDVERGRADWAFNFGVLPAGRRQRLAMEYPRQLHVNPMLGLVYFILNTRAPPFDDVRARRAVNMAVDRAAAVRALGGPDAAAPTCQTLPPNIGGYRSYCPYRRDLARARRLVAASGTKGMRVVVFDTKPATLAYNVVRALRELGYRAKLIVIREAQYNRIAGHMTRTGGHAAQSGWVADYPSASDFIELKLSCREFHPERERNNNPGFCDPAVDRRIDRALALQVSRPSEANRVWASIDRDLTNRAVWVPLVTPKTTDFVSRRVGNYQFHPLWGVLVNQVWVR